MAETGALAASVAYCGLVCDVCPGLGACPGCHAGGGDVDCAVRNCAQERKLAGCWECGDFPCTRGGMGSADWRGLCVACIQSVRERGAEALAERMEARAGRPADWARYKGVAVEDIITEWWD